MQTDFQKRNAQIQDIVLLASLDGDEHKVLRQQLESMTFMSIDVMHKIVTRMAITAPEEQEANSFERR